VGDFALKNGLRIARPKCQVTRTDEVALWTRLQDCNMALSEKVRRGWRYCIAGTPNYYQSCTNSSNTLGIRMHQFPTDPVEEQMGEIYLKTSP